MVLHRHAAGRILALVAATICVLRLEVVRFDGMARLIDFIAHPTALLYVVFFERTGARRPHLLDKSDFRREILHH
jgi:hypothetical protein